LQEQIWISLRPDKKGIQVSEVYDIRVKNCFEEEIGEIWALSPHNCYTRNGTTYPPNVRVASIDRPTIDAEDMQRFNWPFKETWPDTDTDEVVRSFELDLGYRDVDIRSEYFSGKILKAKLSIPEGFTDEHITFLADPRIMATIFRLDLGETKLKKGEAGWIRILVQPYKLSALEVRERQVEGIPIGFEQKLSITCPFLVRFQVHERLGEFKTAEGDKSDITDILGDVRRRVFHEGLYKEGTTSRIREHRIALISEDAIEITDTHAPAQMSSIGVIPQLERIGYNTYHWGWGSDRNIERDIMHNARRVIDMLRYNQPRSVVELANNLAPACKHEMFCVFVENMKKHSLVEPIVGKPGILGTKVTREATDPWNDLDPRRLRAEYIGKTISEHEEHIINHYSDLHPFRIDYRLKWAFFQRTLLEAIRSVVRLQERLAAEAGTKGEGKAL
jgi:hypothetical protein